MILWYTHIKYIRVLLWYTVNQVGESSLRLYIQLIMNNQSKRTYATRTIITSYFVKRNRLCKHNSSTYDYELSGTYTEYFKGNFQREGMRVTCSVHVCAWCAQAPCMQVRDTHGVFPETRKHPLRTFIDIDSNQASAMLSFMFDYHNTSHVYVTGSEKTTLITHIVLL